MDDDGNLPIELMAGQPQDVILQTIYNGSATCIGCGSIMLPTTVMYTGNLCPNCMTSKASKNVNRMMGR